MPADRAAEKLLRELDAELYAQAASAQPGPTDEHNAHLRAADQQFLGEISEDATDQRSLLNKYGPYGSSYSRTSIFNPTSPYGSASGQFSVNNPNCDHPPYFYWNGHLSGVISSNAFLKHRIPTDVFFQFLKENVSVVRTGEILKYISNSVNSDKQQFAAIHELPTFGPWSHVKRAFYWVTIAFLFGFILPTLVRIWPLVTLGSAVTWKTIVTGGGLIFFSNAIIAAVLGDYLLSRSRHIRPLGVLRGFLLPICILTISLFVLSGSDILSHNGELYVTILIVIFALLYAIFTKIYIYQMNSYLLDDEVASGVTARR